MGFEAPATKRALRKKALNSFAMLGFSVGELGEFNEPDRGSVNICRMEPRR